MAAGDCIRVPFAEDMVAHSSKGLRVLHQLLLQQSDTASTDNL
jgi:hypothetical protein